MKPGFKPGPNRNQIRLCYNRCMDKSFTLEYQERRVKDARQLNIIYLSG